MVALYIIILILIVGFAIFYIVKEYVNKPSEKKEIGVLPSSKKILNNKKDIANMVANVESILIYADGNDVLCRRLVEVKENIKFFNPSANDKVLVIDTKIANKLDDLKILVAKDNSQETCFRVLEEVEAYIVQRKKEEQNS